jgi:hypothetical protein
MSSYSVDDLRLQIAQVLALYGDAARAVRRVSPGHQVARLFVTAHLESGLVHLRLSVGPRTSLVKSRSVLIGWQPDDRRRLAATGSLVVVTAPPELD